MGIIKALKLGFDYQRYDDDGNVVDMQRAVNDVDLDIKAGEFVAVLGHNGSGKSTLAKHMNALLIPTEGTMLVDGIDTARETKLWKVRQKAGMVFQNPDNQIVATIVEEDVAFGCENLGIESSEIRKRVDEALKSVDMYEYRERQPHLLSGGQKQRVAIAGIIAMRPECIIFDEATAMLDPSGRKEVMSTIKKLNKEYNITVLHITHFMEEAVEADRVIVMEKGRKILEGSPKEVFSHVDELKSIGLDVPYMTDLAKRLVGQGIDIKSDVLTVDEMVGELCRLK